MAKQRDVEYATAEGNDYAAHEGAYKLFLTLVKWHVILLPIVLILMAYFLV